ncbi:LysR family transcriptional regulator [Limnobacter sp.]|uniref:LysR family transcriptional regulator n=1 Tax=Limnobacter sp. TaxID=2003368 RepID=UPI00300286F7
MTAVARHFHVTQPTVSMQMKELAESVGLPLYEVIGKAVYLTPAGLELETTARAMLAELEAFQQRIDDIKGFRRGRLTVAVVSTAEYFVPRLLGDFCAKYPEVEIALEVLNRNGVIQRLEHNLDDLYIMSKPPANLDVEAKAFMTNSLQVVAPADHPLTQRKWIKHTELARYPFILRERGSGTRLACDSHFESLGFEPTVRLELGSNEAIKQAVQGGMGLAVLSEHALNAGTAAGSLQVLNVQSFPIHANWYTVRPNGKRPSPVAADFWRYLNVDLKKGR